MFDKFDVSVLGAMLADLFKSVVPDQRSKHSKARKPSPTTDKDAKRRRKLSRHTARVARGGRGTNLHKSKLRRLHRRKQ